MLSIKHTLVKSIRGVPRVLMYTHTGVAAVMLFILITCFYAL